MIIDIARQLIEENDLKKKSRKRRNVNRRCYIAKKLRDEGITYQFIADLLDLNHATIIHSYKMANQWERFRDRDYLLDTEHLRVNFNFLVENPVERSLNEFISDVKDCISIRELYVIQERMKRKEYKFETQLE